MYKLLIITARTNGLGGGAGVSSLVVPFDDKFEADTAYEQIKNATETGFVTVGAVKLYKDE